MLGLLQTYRRVLGALGSDRWTGAWLALANVVLAAAAFAEPVLFGRIVNVLTQASTTGLSEAMAQVALPVTLWVVAALFSIVAGVCVALQADRLAHRRRLAVMSHYFEHVLNLPHSFHTDRHSGSLLKIMLEGTSAMQGLWVSFFREQCASLAVLFVMLPISMVLNWRLAVLLLVLVGVFTALSTFVLRKTHKLQASVETFNTNLAEHTSDALGNVPVIQSFTRIEDEARRMREISRDLMAAQTPVLSWWAVTLVATRASSTLTVLGILLMGTYLFSQGLASVGDVVMFMSFATLLIGRLEQVVGFVNAVFNARPKLEQFFKVLDTEPAVRDAPGARDIGRVRGRVSFDHVTFSYDGQRPAVEDVSFTVEPGETVALVGATGSGKSTTLGLLHRVFDPQSGVVSIDGVPLQEMTLLSLRRNIGTVFQEPMLFARTIEDNLRTGDLDADRTAIEAALRRAQALDFVMAQPQGLKTVVGERGRTLSGGERQRLSIARALLKDPPIMILDEATAALDAATEAKLQAALDEVRAGRTTFVIAHRLATIRNADRILLFERGRIVESGSFDELVALGGRFAALAKAQFMVRDEAAPKA